MASLPRCRALPAALSAALPVTLVSLVSLAILAGCGDQGSPESGSDPTSGSTTASSVTSPTQDPTETSSAAPEEPTETVAKPPGLGSALLGAAQLPGLNDGFTWRTTGTKPEGADAFGVCQKTPLVTIGATRALVRTHEPANLDSDAAASQLVAQFADRKSAWRTFEVLKSWREQCADFMAFSDEQVSDLVDVKVPTGDAHRFLVSYAPEAGAETEIVAFGLTRVGRYVSLVQFTLTGQDWNYPAGQEPESVAVRTISGKLAQLG